MADKPSDDDINAFVEHALMEETRSYVERGRSLADRDQEDLFNVWAATVERWFRTRSDQSQRDMDDAAAEIRLRGIEPPEDRLGPLLDQIKEENRRDSRGLNERAREQLRDFINTRDKPKN